MGAPCSSRKPIPQVMGAWQKQQCHCGGRKAQREALTPGVGGTGQIPAISDPTEIFLTSYSVRISPIPIHELLEKGCKSLLALQEQREHPSGIWLQECGQCLLPQLLVHLPQVPAATCFPELPLLLLLGFQLRVVHFHFAKNKSYIRKDS